MTDTSLDKELDLVIISQAQVEFKDKEIALNTKEGIEIIEIRDSIRKFLDVCAFGYISQLALGKLKWKEWVAYSAIETIEAIKQELENISKKHSEYVEAKRKEQEDKKGDEQSQI